jgi:hypothetical protein
VHKGKTIYCPHCLGVLHAVQKKFRKAMMEIHNWPEEKDVTAIQTKMIQRIFNDNFPLQGKTLKEIAEVCVVLSVSSMTARQAAKLSIEVEVVKRARIVHPRVRTIVPKGDIR